MNVVASRGERAESVTIPMVRGGVACRESDQDRPAVALDEAEFTTPIQAFVHVHPRISVVMLGRSLLGI